MKLVLADEAQKLARDRLTHEAWGQRLSVDEFVAREARLRAHPWARGMRTWFLLEDERVLSSCESFDYLSFLDGKRGSSFGIASVYTEPALRGRGHAAKMMELVARELGDRQAGILFSDVGDYYARFGWRAVPAFERVIEPAPADSPAEPIGNFGDWWWKLDLPRARFLVWPTPEELDWHRERERAYADLFRRAPLKFCGARLDGSVIVWAADFKNDKLVILHLQGTRTRELVDAARRQAFDAQLQKIICWDVLAPEDFGEPRPRTDSLPMVLPLQPGSESWSFVPRALWI